MRLNADRRAAGRAEECVAWIRTVNRNRKSNLPCEREDAQKSEAEVHRWERNDIAEGVSNMNMTDTSGREDATMFPSLSRPYFPPRRNAICRNPLKRHLIFGAAAMLASKRCLGRIADQLLYSDELFFSAIRKLCKTIITSSLPKLARASEGAPWLRPRK